MTAFQEHVLNAPDVCNSCFRRIRVERDQTRTSTLRSDVSVERGQYARDRQTTSVEYGPSETASESVGVFCDCGSESAYHRHWDDGEDRCLAMYRFKDLLKRCIYSLEAKGVALERTPFATHAIGAYRDDHDVNAALETGLEAGIQSAIVSGRSKTASLAD